MNTLLRRTSALAAAALAAGALSLPAGTAQAATSAAPTAAAAATWLTAQAKGGIIQSGYLADPTKPSSWTPFPDYGTTGDALIAFDAAGVSPAGAATMRTALTGKLASWTTGADSGYHDVYAGPTAKALVVSQSASGGAGDPTLLSQLEATIQASGRIQDTVDPADSWGADYANTIGQALAAQSLFTAQSPKAAAATDFLLQQQCTGGFFRLYFKDANGANADTTCDSDTAPTPDTDATAYAILALLGQRSTPTVAAAIDSAVHWLETTQKTDGSFIGSVASTATPNANSTGLAGWALGAAGHTDHAAKAAAWLRAHQVTSGPEAGAIAYDDAYLKALTCTGIPQADRGYWQSATAQALPALAYLANQSARGAAAPACPPAQVKAGQVKVTAKPAKSAHRGTVTLKVTAAGKPFAGKVTVKVGNKKLSAKLVHGVARLKAAKVFGGKKKVRATVSFKGSSTVHAFTKHLVLKAKKR